MPSKEEMAKRCPYCFKERNTEGRCPDETCNGHKFLHEKLNIPISKSADIFKYARESDD